MPSRLFQCVVITLCFTATLACAQAPIIDGTQSSASARGKPATSAPAANFGGDMFMQLQTLQQEVMTLRGIVEEQNHQIEALKQQSLDRYNDLDRRMGQPQAGAPAATATDAGAASGIDAAAIPSAAPAAAAVASGQMETAKPEEYEAYQLAYAKLKGQDFPGSIKAFTAFNAAYPSSPLTANSYYWLGKAYLQPPQDLAAAQQAFAKVVGDYPQHNKAPDALYELGKVHFLKGDKDKAKTLLQQVIDNYGASGSSAPQFAKQFIDQNYGSGKR